MLELNRITDAASMPDELMALYREAFPEAERRSQRQLYYLIGSCADFYFNEIRYNGVSAGLFVYWDFGEFYFMEHLAVFPSMRNHRIGTKLLEYAAEQLRKPRILEVEPAGDEMAARRIGYYERNGYTVVDRGYVQPAFDATKTSIPLWIMASEPLENDRLERYIHTVVERAYEANRSWNEK